MYTSNFLSHCLNICHPCTRLKHFLLSQPDSLEDVRSFIKNFSSRSFCFDLPSVGMPPYMKRHTTVKSTATDTLRTIKQQLIIKNKMTQIGLFVTEKNIMSANLTNVHKVGVSFGGFIIYLQDKLLGNLLYPIFLMQIIHVTTFYSTQQRWRKMFWGMGVRFGWRRRINVC